MHIACNKLFEQKKEQLLKVAGHEIVVNVNDNRIIDGNADSHSYEGSFIAAFIRDLMIEQHQSFSFETVMSHPSKVEEIKFLISKGYLVYLYFVCIDDPDVNVSSVILHNSNQ